MFEGLREFLKEMMEDVFKIMRIVVSNLNKVDTINSSNMSALIWKLEQKGVLTRDDTREIEEKADKLFKLNIELHEALDKCGGDLDNGEVVRICQETCELVGIDYHVARAKTEATVKFLTNIFEADAKKIFPDFE